MEEKKLSMVDIAKRSGVSIATVSRIINKNGRYSKETERRVLDVIEKSGYQLNLNAKSLRTNKSQTIGVIVPDITNEFFAKIVRSVEKYIMPKGYTVIVCDSDESEKLESTHISTLAAKGVDGIIHISTCSDVKKIQDMYPIPVVYIDRRPKNAGSLVISDNETGGFLATKHLIEKGCRRILMVRDKNPYSTVRHRYLGYVGAHEQFSIDVDKSLVIEAEVSYSAAKNAVLQKLKEDKTIDGIFCNNDNMALGALHAALELGYKIPDDIKIVGFDDITITQICNPPITTVRQDTDLFGKKSVEILLKMMKEESKNVVDDVAVIPTTLIERSTT
ncbi:MAG: LacI family DNA-binding transcriptional regulator [Acutalibacteraceae bacterium]